jgi:hypothetical protein
MAVNEEKLKNIESMIESIFSENKKLKEALKFYAEEKNIVNWRDYIVFKDEIQCNYRQINETEYLENGTTARKILEELINE